MRFRTILLEYNRDKTLDNYGSPMWSNFLNRDTAAREDYREYVKLHPKTDGPVWILDQLEKIDPTKKKMFVKYLAKWYANGMRLEDAYKAVIPMELFVKFRNRITADLNSMTFSQFLDLGDELGAAKSIAALKDEEEQAFFKNRQASLYYNDENIKVIIPHTMEAAQYFGKGTRWCTSSLKHNMFDHYAKNGNLFIILFKGSSDRWQFHFQDQQFMDAADEALPNKKIRDCAPVQKAFRSVFEYYIKESIAGEVSYQIGANTLALVRHPEFEDIEKLLNYDEFLLQNLEPLQFEELEKLFKEYPNLTQAIAFRTPSTYILDNCQYGDRDKLFKIALSEKPDLILETPLNIMGSEDFERYAKYAIAADRRIAFTLYSTKKLTPALLDYVRSIDPEFAANFAHPHQRENV